MLDLLDIARKWVAEKGWEADGYDFKVSEVQSCPEGKICLLSSCAATCLLLNLSY